MIRLHDIDDGSPGVRARLVVVSGIGYICDAPHAPDALAQEPCTLRDLRWAGFGDPRVIDVFDRQQVAINEKELPGPVRITVARVRCRALAVFGDDDLETFGCRFEEFTLRPSTASQDVMRWVRQRWGIDAIVTSARTDENACNLAVARVPAADVLQRLDTRLVHPAPRPLPSAEFIASDDISEL